MAAETEGNDKQEQVRAQTVLSALLRAMSGGLGTVSRLGSDIPAGGKDHSLHASFVTSRSLTHGRLCEVGPEDRDKQREDKKQWESRKYNIFIVDKVKK